ncbi:MAG: putative Ig domain-containing protein [Acidobacteria bacterium]|nr:putative Ig domain-containing protein [Acidobacteriota bacterium]
MLLGKLAFGVLAAAVCLAQIPGRNVNMVSGIGWPTGDPFLQRQNEPSIGVSTRNPLHLLAGSNDYRTVDVPGIEGSKATGDAWLGVFKSRDGGLSWTSTLLPGYPQDRSVTGRNSVLFQKGYKAGADPVVRSGTNGMFYYAGLGFVRSNTGLDGATGIFLARFIDNNNSEGAYATYTKNGRVIPYTRDADPIKYLDNRMVAEGVPSPTSTVTSGPAVSSTFLDKPWLAVDIPRTGALNCVVGGGESPVQTFPGGNVYLVWTAFENGDDTKGRIMFSRSRDCGATFGPAIQVASSATANQGATLAIEPATGALYVVWRRFATPGSPHGMMISKSTDFGVTFSAPQTIATAGTPAAGQVLYSPFDQGSTIVDSSGNVIDARFRTNGYPTMGIDASGRIYVAWSQRGAGPNGDARIVITSSVGGQNWTPPIAVDSSTTFRGHQVMPAMSLAAGKLTLVYYDLRDSNTKGIFKKDDRGGGYQETRQPIGDRQSGSDSKVFTEDISDTYRKPDGTRAPLAIRQTMDVRVAQTELSALSFQASRLSDYSFGSRPPAPGSSVASNPIIEQMQLNPPNLPMFALGTTPFMGDYIDVAALPFVVGTDGKWAFNLAPTESPVFHAVWTDNRDVRPPSDGNWRNYTPPNVALTLAAQLRGPGFPANTVEADLPAPKIENGIAATSLVDPALNRLACVPGQTGMRNQNIYTARITNGLVASSPTNSKPLNTAFARAFVVTGQNTTKQTKTFRLSIANQPVGGRASFSQTGKQGVTGDILRLDTRIPPNGTISRPVFILSTNATATVRVDFTEITAPGGTVVVGGLKSTVVLNRDSTNPPLRNPDINNPDINNPDINNREVYNPDINNPDINNPDINNPDINNPDINNPDINNPDINNPDINNPDINNPDINNPDINNLRVANPDINNPDINNPDINNPDINNPDINNPDINNPDINNPDINNPDINNGSYQDVSWKVTNKGNTYASYSLKTLLTGAGIPDGFRKRLVVYKVYGTPVSDGCSLKYMAQNQILLYVNNPVFSAQSQIANPNISDSSESNATVALGPGETARLLLRVLVPNTQPNFKLTDVVAAATTAQAVNTNDISGTPKFAASKLFITTANPLPSTQVGAVYTAQLENAGGFAPIVWSLVPKVGEQLPNGVNLSASGMIQGQPTVAGTFKFTVLATDSDPGSVKQTAVQTFSIVVAAPPPLTIVTPATLPFGFVGLNYATTLQSGGGVGAKTWGILPGSTLPASFVLNPSTGQLTGTIPATGIYTFTARVTDSSPVPMVATKLMTLQVSPITLVFSTQPANTPASQPFSVKVRAQDSGANPLAGVTVTLALAPTAPAGAVLAGTLTAATALDGQATFSGLNIALSADYQFIASANGATAATSRVFTIQPLPGFIQTIAGRAWSPSLAPTTATSFPLGEIDDAAVDAAGNLYVPDLGNHIVVRITPAGALTVVAGTGASGYSGDGGPATAAMLAFPSWVAVHPVTGDLYIADLGNRRIRKVAAGVITTVAGTGSVGFSGDDGPAVEAQISSPGGMAFDASGNLYFADSGNQRVRRIDPSGVITTIAGSASVGYGGDGGPATSALLNSPSDVDVIGTTIYVADSGNNRVRQISGGTITTFAGTGGYGASGDGGAATAATLARASGLAHDAAGNLYISTEHVIRRVAPGGTISTYAGTAPGFTGDGGPAVAARVNLPYGLAADAAGNLFIADSFNQRVRRVDAGTKNISTFAGNGQFKDGGDGGSATSAYLNSPFGVAVDATGNVYIADSLNSRVRRLDSTGRLTTFAGNGNPGGTGDTGPATSATLGDFMTDVAVDKAGNVYVADNGYDGVRRITPAGTISRFYTSPVSTIAFDSANNAYLADERNHRVLRIPAAGGPATIFAGGNGAGFSGDGGLATAAKLNAPRGLAIDGAGNVFISDNLNARIRLVSPSGVISTYAGNGTFGFTGDGGPATSASIRAYGLALDAKGNLYIGAANNSAPVRRIDTAGIITTIAGNGTAGFSGDGAPAAAAQLRAPARVAVDAAGNLYISDGGNDRIRRVTLPPSPAGNPAQRLTITTTTLPNGVYNALYSSTLAAVGGSGARTWSIVNGTLPTGVTLNPSTGLLSGLISSVGAYPLTVQVTASGASAQALLTLTVGAPAGSTLSFGTAIPPQTAGAIFPTAVTVLATGPGSVPLVGALVTLSIGTNPVNGVLTGTLNRTTNASGIATFNDLAIDLGANGYTLRASSVGFASPATSNSFDVALATGGITTVAGRSWQISPAPGTAATTVPISENRGLAFAINGDILMPDTFNGYVYRITPAGALSVIAGTGISAGSSYPGDGQLATAVTTLNNRAPATSAAGHILFSDANGRILKIDAATQRISSVAGTGVQGYSGDGGPATAAQIRLVQGIAVEELGGGLVNLYLADGSDNRIRKINSAGIISTLAGTGTAGYNGDGIAANTAQINQPTAIALRNGKLFFTEGNGRRVRQVDLSTNLITTVAGTGNAGYNGDGIAATSANLSSPQSLSIDAAGNLYIADTAAQRVRRVDTSTGIISTIAGTGEINFTGDGGLAVAAAIGSPSSILVNPAGTLIYVWDDNAQRLRKIDATGTITTFAGNGSFKFSGDGGPATSANLWQPNGVFVDPAGNLLISARLGSRIRKVTAGTNTISTVAGTGVRGFAGNGGPATSALLTNFTGHAVVHPTTGEIYISDTFNNRIRRVDATGIITTFAGNGNATFAGVGGPASAASFNGPRGLLFDPAGNLLVADSSNHVIRSIDPSGVVTTVVGIPGANGSSGDGGSADKAKLNLPSQIARDGLGNYYIAEVNNHCVRMVTPTGIISTFAGQCGGTTGFSGDGEPATAATLGSAIFGVAADNVGNVYFSDTNNNRIRKVDTAGIISTIAGNGAAAFSGDGGPATAAALSAPQLLHWDPISGNLFVADLNNDRVRMIKLPSKAGVASKLTITTTSLPGGSRFVPYNATVQASGGTLPYTWSAIDAGGFTINPSSGVVSGTMPATANVAGDHLINVTVTDAAGKTAQASFLVSINWADTLTFLPQPGNIVAGASLAPFVVSSPSLAGALVTVGAYAPGSTSPATRSTVTADGAGNASFASFPINTPGNGYVLRASVGPVSFDSNSFNVSPTSGGVMTVAGKDWVPVLSPVATSHSLGQSRFSVLDAAGNLYVSDESNNIVVKVTPGGAVSVVAGSAFVGGFAGDGGPATSALLNTPRGLALDGAANLLYIADGGNLRIRRVNLTTGIITTVAGSGAFSSSGDGGSALAASFLTPFGLALSAGDLYVSEQGGHRIRRITLASGLITTVAGSGVAGYSGDGAAATSARLNLPTGIAVDASGNLAIADSSNSRIRLVSGGVISTITGTGSCSFNGDGGAASAAVVCNPSGVAFRGTDLYVADTFNNRVRKISGGIISTVAGTGAFATATDGTTALSAPFTNLNGVTVSPAGDLYIHDFYSRRIMKVNGGTQLVTNVLGNGQFRNQAIGAGPATDLWVPYAITGDASGNIYFTQDQNFAINKLSPAGVVTQLVGNKKANSNSPDGPGNTLAAHFPEGIAVVGTDVYFAENARIRKIDGTSGAVTTYANAANSGGSTDGPVATARFNGPRGLAYDASRQLMFVADAANHRIRQINMATGTVTTVAGTGGSSFSGDGGPATSATLQFPQGLTFDQIGNLYIADTNNCVVRMVNPSGVISTIAGTAGNCGTGGGDGGPAISGTINAPQSVAVDTAGNVFISEQFGNRIRKVDLAGIITTINSTGGAGFTGDGGPLSGARVNAPRGLYFNAAGTLYIADSQNNRVRAAFGIGTMTGNGRFTLLAANFPAATAGQTYLLGGGIPNAGGSAGTRTFTVIAGALPVGLTINASNGTFSGGPNVPGFYSFTVRGTDNGTGQTSTGTYLLTVNTPASVTMNFINPPSNTTRGTTFPVSVGLSTPYIGVPITLSLATNPGGGTLSGTLTQTTNASGFATFTGLSIDKVGEGYVLQAAVPGMTSLSPAFNITGITGDVVTFAGTDWVPPLSAPTAAAYPFAVGRGVTFDASGNMYAVDSAAHIVVKVAAGGGLTTRIAGTGKGLYSADGGLANVTSLLNPVGLALDASGNIYIAESLRIRRVDAVTGIITTVAGNGNFGSSGDGGLATAAQLGCPSGLAFSGSVLYVADSCFHKIRRFSIGGNISTFAGSGTAGFSGDGGGVGIAPSAQLSSPWGLAFDGLGNLLIADSGNYRVRLVTPDQNITTFAGNGACCNEGFGGAPTLAALGPVYGVAASGGAVFLSTTSSIRRVQGGGIVRLAGNGLPGFTGDGGPATSARIMGGFGIALDASSSIYFADGENKRIRKIDSATDNISTYLGATPGLYGGDGGAATSANLFSPRGVTGDSSGNLYIAEDRGYRVRKVTAAGVISTVAGTGVFDDTSTSDSNNPPNSRVGRVAGVAVGPLGQLFISDGGPSVLSVDTNNPLVPVRAIGTGAYGNSPDGTLASAAQLGNTYSLAYDAPRNELYFADAGNLRIRKVNLTTQVLTTVAGNGASGYSGDGGPATSASFRSFYTGSLAVDSLGNLYIGDNDACVIRMVNLRGVISTLAGNGSCGTPVSGLSANQSIGLPQGLTVDVAGNVYFADRFTSTVYRVGLDGILTSLNAGCCTGGDGGPFSAARLSGPQGLYISPATGTLYIADQSNDRVRTAIGIGAITGNGRLSLANTTLATATVGAPYSDGPLVAGGTGTGRVFSITAGSLPTGLTLNPSTGSISGNPTGAGGAYNFTLRVTETTPAQTATGQYTLLLSGGPLALLASTLPNAVQGQAFNLPNAFPVTGGTGIGRTFTISEGSLPPGLNLEASTGRVFGTPSTLIDANFEVTVTETGGASSIRNYELISMLAAIPVWITSPGNATLAGQNLTLAPVVSFNPKSPTSFGVLITLSLAGNANGAVLSGTTTVATDSGGAATFTDLKIDKAGNGYTLIATMAGGGVAVSPAFNIAAGSGEVVTVAGKDWAPPLSAASGTSYPLGQGYGVAFDASNNMYVADTQAGTVLKMTPVGVTTRIAGTGISADGPLNVAATSTTIATPRGVAVDAAGDVYVAAGARVLKISASTGLLTAYAGTGTMGNSGDGGPALAATFGRIMGLAADSSGNLYLTDEVFHRVRRITPGGTVQAVAGTGSSGFSGDGGPATSAELNWPRGVAVDAATGDILIADTFNHRIRRISGGTISTVAGNGFSATSGDGGAATSAGISAPYGVAVLGSKIYIANSGGCKIRVASAGIINTLAGAGSSCFVYDYKGDGGPAASAQLAFPLGVAVDSSGNVYHTEQYSKVVRRTDASTFVITRVLGNSQGFYGGDGGQATSANLNKPFGITADGSGNLLVAEEGGNRLRKISSAGVISTYAGTGFLDADTSVTGTATSAGLGPVTAAAVVGTDVYLTEQNGAIRKIDLSQNITRPIGNGGFGFSGEGTAASGATFTSTRGLAYDAPRNLLYVVDHINFRIRKINLTTGIITTVAGTGSQAGIGDASLATSASFIQPEALTVDANGNLYITDFASVRMVTPAGVIQTVAGQLGSGAFGGDGGAATAAYLLSPAGVAIDAAGNVFIADTANNRIRKVGTDGKINSLNAGAGFGGDGGPVSAALFNQPRGLYINPANGTLYISDSGNHRVRAVTAAAATAGNGRITLQPATLAQPKVGVPFTATAPFPVVGGTGAGRTFSIAGTGTDVGFGLTMNAATGTITGTPTQQFSRTFILSVTDSSGLVSMGSYQLDVLP